MLLDRLKDMSDLKKLNEELPEGFFAEVTENTSQCIMDIMFSVIRVLLSKFKLPEEEIDNFIRKVKEVKSVGGWFEHFEGFDIPAEREKLREEREELDKAKEELDKAKEELREKEVEIYINAFKEMEMSKEKVAERVVIKFSLSLEKAESKVEQYW